MATEEIKAVLEKLNFPERFISDQTAICIMAFLDKSVRSGLLAGHTCLNEGARIHDILNFARTALGRNVAENTREAYRKTSLAPLMNYGLIVRHQLTTNDPNTYYRLRPDFERLFLEKNRKEQAELINKLQLKASRVRKLPQKKTSSHASVPVMVRDNQVFSLSPGAHNQLEKATVEVFGNIFLDEPQVVYLGDTAPRKGYQNRTLMRRLNLPIDTSASLPDVILFSEPEKNLVIVEVVTSSGTVNAIRIEQLEELAKKAKKLGIKTDYVTAFSSRAVFRKFAEEIAWGSSVWIEKEPHNIIHFQEI